MRFIRFVEFVPSALVLAAGLLAASIAAAGEGQMPREVVLSIEAGYYQHALTQLQALLQSEARSPQIAFRMGQILLGLHRTAEARETLEAAVKQYPLESSLHRLLGEAYGAEAKTTGPIDAFRLARATLAEFIEAVRVNPNDVESQVNLALFYIEAPGVVGGSVEKAHQLEASIEKLSPLLALQTRATEAAQGQDWPAAERILKQAIRIDPGSGSLLQLGQMYLDAGRPADALSAFATMTQAHPESSAALYWFGRAAAESKTQLTKGMESLRRYLALRERPDNAPAPAWAHLMQARLCALNAMPSCARSELEAARNFAPAKDSDFAARLKETTSMVVKTE